MYALQWRRSGFMGEFDWTVELLVLVLFQLDKP